MSTRGLNKYDDKEKRQVRRRNHVAKDLTDRKFHQRVVPPKRRDYDWTDDLDVVDNYDFDDDYWLDKNMGLTSKE
jgi:hypothetical protein